MGLDLTTGEARWTNERDGVKGNSHSLRTVHLDGNPYVLACFDPGVRLIDPATGETLWHDPTGIGHSFGTTYNRRRSAKLRVVGSSATNVPVVRRFSTSPWFSSSRQASSFSVRTLPTCVADAEDQCNFSAALIPGPARALHHDCVTGCRTGIHRSRMSQAFDPPPARTGKTLQRRCARKVLPRA